MAVGNFWDRSRSIDQQHVNVTGPSHMESKTKNKLTTKPPGISLEFKRRYQVLICQKCSNYQPEIPFLLVSAGYIIAIININKIWSTYCTIIIHITWAPPTAQAQFPTAAPVPVSSSLASALHPEAPHGPCPRRRSSIPVAVRGKGGRHWKIPWAENPKGFLILVTSTEDHWRI